MKYRVIKPEQIKETDLGEIKVKQLLNQIDVPNMSLAVIKIDGSNKKIINTLSDSMYYEVENVASGDVIFIPKGAAYFDQGKMTLLCFNSPRFTVDEIIHINNEA